MSTTTLDIRAGGNNYSLGSFTNDFASRVTSRDGAQDLLEGVINISEWVNYLGISQRIAGEAVATLSPVNEGFAIPNFFHHVNRLRDQFRVAEFRESDQFAKETFKHLALLVANVAKCGMFCHSTRICLFEKSLQGLKGTCWGALGLVDGANIYHLFSDLERYRTQLNSAESSAHRDIINSKINLTYLQINQSVTLVAIAAISLVSLLFASLAQGILFSVPVMLGLSSVWIALSFVSYFYEKVIAHRENNLLN